MVMVMMAVGVGGCGGGVERGKWRRELIHFGRSNEVNEDFFGVAFCFSFFFCSRVGVLVGGDVVECG